MKCSVLIPSYNYAQFVGQALESVAAQTFRDFEIVIVDDGSTDNSIDVIQGWIERNSHLKTKLLFHPNRQNRHIVETYELGLKNCSGEYIAFLEADDYWKVNSLEQRVALLERQSEVGIVGSLGIPVDADGKANASFQVEYLKHLEHLHAQTFGVARDFSSHYRATPSSNVLPSFSAVMVRSNILHQLNRTTKHNSWFDCWLWAQAAQRTKFIMIQEKLFYWRIHSSSQNTRFVGSIDLQSYTSEFEEDLKKVLI